jgi:hypothetical protein
MERLRAIQSNNCTINVSYLHIINIWTKEGWSDGRVEKAA